MSARRSALLVAVAALALSVPAVARAGGGTTYTWVGNTLTAAADNHSWSDSRNWSPAGVPGSGDSVVIEQPSNSDCFAHVDNVPTVTLANLTLVENPALCTTSVSGGAFTVTGSFSWDGGKLDTPTTIASGATATISGADQRLNSLTQAFDVAGGAILSAATGSGALQILHGQSLHVEAGATLSSSGTNAIGGSACCTDPAKVINDGTVSVGSGTLTVSDAELDQRATVTVAAGGELLTSGGPVTTGTVGSYTGAGRWLLENRAAAHFAGTQTLGTGFHLEFGGLASTFTSTLAGSATLRGAGTFDWTGGVIEAQLTFAHGLAVHVNGVHTGGAQRVLQGHDLSGGGGGVPVSVTNHAVVTVAAGATISTAGQARLVNAADGTVALAPGTSVASQGCCTAPDSITNAGTVHVLAGPGTGAVSLALLAYQSTGTTVIAAGRTLQLSGGARGRLAGGVVSGGGRLTITTPLTLSGMVTVAASTQVLVGVRGSLDGAATLGGAGSTAWTGGALSGALTMATAGGISVYGANPKTVANDNGGSTPSTVAFTAPATFAAGTATVHDVVALGASTLVLRAAANVGAFVQFAGGRLVNQSALAIHQGPIFASAYQQAGGGRLTLDVSATRNGVVQVSGPAALAGKVAVRNLVTPASGRKVTVVVAVTLHDALTCVRTTGAGATSGHWAAVPSATRLVLVWRRGAVTC